MPLPSHQCSFPGTLQIITLQLLRDAAKHAPHSPPTSAWEELDGNPKYQVSKFHTMPPINAHTMTSEVTMFVSTNPDAMVLATAVPHNAPSRLVMAARTMA